MKRNLLKSCPYYSFDFSFYSDPPKVDIFFTMHGHTLQMCVWYVFVVMAVYQPYIRARLYLVSTEYINHESLGVRNVVFKFGTLMFHSRNFTTFSRRRQDSNRDLPGTKPILYQLSYPGMDFASFDFSFCRDKQTNELFQKWHTKKLKVWKIDVSHQ